MSEAKKYILISVTTREEYDHPYGGGHMFNTNTFIIEKTEGWAEAYAGSEEIESVKELGEMPENYTPQIDFSKLSKEEQDNTNDFDLKEIAHFYGGWNELRKIIDRLEESDNEAAHERAMNRD